MPIVRSRVKIKITRFESENQNEPTKDKLDLLKDHEVLMRR